MSVNERARHRPDPQRRKLLEHARAATGGLALGRCIAPLLRYLSFPLSICSCVFRGGPANRFGLPQSSFLFFQRSKGKVI